MLFSVNIATQVSTANAANTWGASVFTSIQVVKDDDPATPPFINQFDSTKDYLWYRENFVWHQSGMLFGYPSVDTTSGAQQGQYDIRAKRKIPEGYGLSFQCWNNDTSVGAFWSLVGIQLYTSGRFLMLDH